MGVENPERRGARRPTMRDVAARARVSLKTVSRVVNGEPGVLPTLTVRVREAIEELDFRPNVGAEQPCAAPAAGPSTTSASSSKTSRTRSPALTERSRTSRGRTVGHALHRRTRSPSASRRSSSLSTRAA